VPACSAFASGWCEQQQHQLAVLMDHFLFSFCVFDVDSIRCMFAVVDASFRKRVVSLPVCARVWKPVLRFEIFFACRFCFVASRIVNLSSPREPVSSVSSHQPFDIDTQPNQTPPTLCKQ
jgi:hypothetical protein